MALESVQIPVRGMTCGNCARSVERKLTGTRGVSSARVDLHAGIATVEYDPEKVQAAGLAAAIRQLGFEVPA